MLQRILLESVSAEFPADRITRTAHAGPLGVTALDHESRDDAVEDQPVVETGTCQRDEIADGIRRVVRIEFGSDDASVFHGDGYNWILCHVQ